MSVIYFIFQQTMLFTIPLMIVALGGMFSERSGVVNIALEGIMTMGAFTGILFLNMTGDRMSGQLQLLLAILISTATGRRCLCRFRAKRRQSSRSASQIPRSPTHHKRPLAGCQSRDSRPETGRSAAACGH